MKQLMLRPTAFFCIFSLFAIITANKGYAAVRRSSGLENRISSLSEQVEQLKHELANNESDTTILRQKYLILEEIVESLKREIDLASSEQQANFKLSKKTMQSKIETQDGAIKGFVSDLKELKHHSNLSTDALKEQSKKIAELENIISTQEKKIDKLTSLLKTLMNALDTPEVSGDYTVYKVKFGDSLGVIAQKHGVKVSSIKKLNTLTSDTIFSGQVLKIPNKTN